MIFERFYFIAHEDNFLLQMTKLGSCLMSGDYSIDPNIMSQSENKDFKQVSTYLKLVMVPVSILTMPRITRICMTLGLFFCRPNLTRQ